MNKRKKTQRTGKRHGKPNSKRTGRRAGGRLGDPSGRGYPPTAVRKRTIESIQSIPVKDRVPNDWYVMGSLLVYEACLEDDDILMNDGSAALVEAATATSPIPDAILDLTWLLNLRGLPAIALDYAKKATELLANRRDSWVFRANTHLQLKQKDQAIDCLRRAVELASSTPEDKELLKRLESGEGNEIGGQGVIGFSSPFLNQPLHQSPEDQTEQIKLQLFYTRQMLRLMPDDIDVLYLTVMGYYHLQQFDQAEIHLAQLFVVDDSHADGLCAQALIHQKKRNDLEKAQEFYVKAIKAKPDHVLANSNLAKILMDEQGKVREAQLHLQAALDADPTYAVALSMYGNTIAYLEQDFKRESEYHAKALKYGPVFPQMRYCYIMSLLQAGEFWQLKKVWKKHSSHLGNLSSFGDMSGIAEAIVEVIPMILNPPRDFDTCLGAASSFMRILKGRALTPLLEQAWNLRETIPSDPPEQRRALLEMLGSIAAQCDDHEFALTVFREIETHEGEGGGASINVAVTLGHLGNHEAAITKASNTRDDLGRKFTMLGNIYRDSGDYENALANYRLALEKDQEGFTLPICAGLSTSISLSSPEDIKHFVVALESESVLDINAKTLLARGYSILGFPKKAFDLLNNHEMDNAVVQSGEDSGLPDFSVFEISPDYTRFAHQQLMDLAKQRLWESEPFVEVVDSLCQRELFNGDTKVILAEGARQLGSVEEALALLAEMKIQAPPIISKALCFAGQGKWQLTRDTLSQLSECEPNRIWTHPEGSPNAIANAIHAWNMLEENYPKEALKEANKCIDKDPFCTLGHLFKLNSLLQLGQVDIFLESLDIALYYNPGNPKILELAVNALVDLNHLERADELLNAYAEHLSSFAAESLYYQLSDSVARAKLSTSMQKPKLDVDWANHLHKNSQQWLQEAFEISELIKGNLNAVGMYYAKIAERELLSKVIEPFTNNLRGQSFSEDKYSPILSIAKMLEKGWPTNLGAIIRAIRVVDRPETTNKSKLMVLWLDYLSSKHPKLVKLFLQRDRGKAISKFGRIRNGLCHVESLTADEFQTIEPLIRSGRQPGTLLKAIGV